MDLSGLDVARFGFGSGSRPLAFFGRHPSWMLPIPNKWTCHGVARFALGLARGFWRGLAIKTAGASEALKAGRRKGLGVGKGLGPLKALDQKRGGCWGGPLEGSWKGKPIFGVVGKLFGPLLRS